MAIYDYKGKRPQIAESCFVAPSADLIGEVEVAEGSSIWYGVVLRGDIAPIRIGRNCSIQDNSTFHVDDDTPVILGDNVTVGHGCIVHAATVEDCCLIGMGAVILNGAHVGRGSVIGAGAVVPPNAVIPPFSQVMGVPGRVVKQLDPSTEQARLRHAEAYVKLGREFLASEEE
ncbi:MAG: gamma carbonic anhydrase family protein [Bacillota bacterium]|nr:gamma carbonic anhydrase family protein [Bacillota bacterium]